MGVKILILCLACGSDFPAEAINCPRCVVTHAPEHLRLKEAHTVRALEAAVAACGIPCPVKDEPAVISVVETDAQGRSRLVTKENGTAHNSAKAKRAVLEEGFYQGSKGAPVIHRGEHLEPKEAHVVLGSDDAIGSRAAAAISRKRAKDAASRSELVKAIAAELEKNPASAVALTRQHGGKLLADALELLGVSLDDEDQGDEKQPESPAPPAKEG